MAIRTQEWVAISSMRKRERDKRLVVAIRESNRRETINKIKNFPTEDILFLHPKSFRSADWSICAKDVAWKTRSIDSESRTLMKQKSELKIIMRPHFQTSRHLNGSAMHLGGPGVMIRGTNPDWCTLISCLEECVTAWFFILNITKRLTVMCQSCLAKFQLPRRKAAVRFMSLLCYCIALLWSMKLMIEVRSVPGECAARRSGVTMV